MSTALQKIFPWAVIFRIWGAAATAPFYKNVVLPEKFGSILAKMVMRPPSSQQQEYPKLLFYFNFFKNSTPREHLHMINPVLLEIQPGTELKRVPLLPVYFCCDGR